jgi:four helix bundle protein
MTLPPAERFEDLIVWQKSHALVLRVYKLSATFPRQEIYGLTSQMRRCDVSVPSNIAEGFAKRSRTDKARFYNVAQGSLEELRYYFILSRDLGYIAADSRWGDLDEVARLLNAYTKSVLAESSNV